MLQLQKVTGYSYSHEQHVIVIHTGDGARLHTIEDHWQRQRQQQRKEPSGHDESHHRLRSPFRYSLRFAGFLTSRLDQFRCISFYALLRASCY